MIGREVIELVAPESRSIAAESIRLGREEIFEHRLLRQDGSSFYGEARARYARVGGRSLRMTALRDITDHNLPTFSGAEALDLIRDIGLNIPTLCVTGSADPAKITEVLNARACALISKDNLTPLCAAVTSALNRSAPLSNPPGRSGAADDAIQ